MKAIGKKGDKKSPLKADRAVKAKIPYVCCYEEDGIIETDRGVFSKSYLVGEVNPDEAANTDMELLNIKTAQLIAGFPQDVSFQFVVHNKQLPYEDFLKRTVFPQNREAEVNPYIECYNRVLVSNASIGHNNTKAARYFTLSLRAGSIDEAIRRFQELDRVVKSRFDSVCKLDVKTISLAGRMNVLYSILNPGKYRFGAKTDLDRDGKFSTANMRKLNMTTKDVIAPEKLKEERDHLIINGDTCVRSFFISSVPVSISPYFMPDLMTANSSMVLSIHYEPLDTQLGFEAAKDKMGGNTSVKTLKVRDTIRDKKSGATKKVETMKYHSEEVYFENAALSTFKNALAGGNRLFSVSIVITIYAEDMETLERDTKLLRISASKFACQIRSLDTQHLKGLQSVLPLGEIHCDIRRIFSSERLALLSPLNIQEVYAQNGLYHGLNAINDNLILYNRRNAPALGGVIAGVETSGKTYQCKREIMNALISTRDRVLVLHRKDDYGRFIRTLGGSEITVQSRNPFLRDAYYGLTDQGNSYKEIMLEAFFASMQQERGEFLNVELDGRIAMELEELCRAGGFSADFQKITELLTDKKRFPVLGASWEGFSCRQEVEADGGARLQGCRIESASELVLMLDWAWNRILADLRKNVQTWVFVDGVDELLHYPQGAAYLAVFVRKCDRMRVVTTFVVQSSVLLFAKDSTAVYFEEFLRACSYFKLLNQGAIERKRYMDILNISGSLLPYITNQTPGKGVILTPTRNVAFDDSYVGDEENAITKLLTE